MSFRRFVNLVSSDGVKSVYSLRRIDMSRFFLPTTTNGTMKQQQEEEYSALPDPVINFYTPVDRSNSCGDMDFMLVDDKVVATDKIGGAFMYDTGKNAVRSLPASHTRFKTTITISLTVGSDLYVIDRLTNGTGTRNFEALVYKDLPYGHGNKWNWHWRALRPPPPPPPCLQEKYDRTSIESCAAFADGSHIWMSAIGEGAVKSCTHRFDTEGLVWSKQPADWVLPFDGSAQYVPELQNLWFGISSREYGRAFCAADLATASLSQPPVLRNVFDDGMAPGVPEDRLIKAHAVRLGSGRFCIARYYCVLKKPADADADEASLKELDASMKDLGTTFYFCSQLDYDKELFVVLAGVEVVSGGDGKLSLVKHRSERYMILDYEQLCVL